MFLYNSHIFIDKQAMLRQKFTVQVTTLPDCDDITRFDGRLWTTCRFYHCLFRFKIIFTPSEN